MYDPANRCVKGEVVVGNLESLTLCGILNPPNVRVVLTQVERFFASMRDKYNAIPAINKNRSLY